MSFSLLEKYFTLVESMKEPAEVFNFWQSNRSALSELSTIALQVLPAPATTSSCERDFSLAGLFTESRKANLSPDNLNAKIILTANKGLIKTLDPII